VKGGPLRVLLCQRRQVPARLAQRLRKCQATMALACLDLRAVAMVNAPQPPSEA